MAQTKVITIKKRGGGTRRQAVEVLKSGKFKFIKNTSSKLKSKAKRLGSKIKSKSRRRSASKNNKKTNKQPVRSHRSVQKLSLYPRKKISEIAIKTGIGAAIGIAIRLATKRNRNPNVRIFGARAAQVAASYGGGGTGNLAYNAIDTALQFADQNGMSSNGAAIPRPMIGAA